MQKHFCNDRSAVAGRKALVCLCRICITGLWLIFGGLMHLSAQVSAPGEPDLVNCSPIPTTNSASPCQTYPFTDQSYALYGLSVTDIVNASSVTSTTVTFENVNVIIRGTLTVNKNIIFRNCKVKIIQGSTIITQGNFGIYGLSNTVFFACTGLWNGIVVNSGGFVVLSNAQISEAITAVTLRPGYNSTRSSIAYTKFFRNLTGISAGDASGQVTRISFSQFSGNEFDGTRSYLVPGNNTTPYIVPVLAIALNNVNGVMVGSVSPNFIRYFKKGIDIQNSTVTLNNFQLQDFYYASDFGFGTGLPVGIKALNSVFRTTGSQQSGGMRFTNVCGEDILAENCEINFAGQTHSGYYQYGIHAVLRSAGNAAPYMASTTINTSKFNPNADRTTVCISVDRGDHISPSFEHTIADNTFDLPGVSHGIWVWDKSSSNAKDKFIIRNNTDFKIHNRHSTCGIKIEGKSGNQPNESLNFIIDDNQIQSDGAAYGPYFPISLIDCDGDMLTRSNIVRKNILSSTEPDLDNGLCGIHIQRSITTYICNNTSRGHFRGFHFMGDCRDSYFGDNTIGNNQIGLHIQTGACLTPALDPGIIGNQIRTSNYWELLSYEAGNQIDPNCSMVVGQLAARCDANPQPSQFIVEQSDPHRLPTDIEPAMNWFSEQAGELNACTQTFTAQASVSITPTEQTLLSGGATSIQGSASSIRDVTVSLLSNLMRQPQTNNTPLWANYLAGHQTAQSAAWKFAKAGLDLVTATQIPAAMYTVIDNLQAELNALYQQTDVLVAGGIEGNEVLSAQLDSLLALIALKEQDKKNTVQFIKAQQGAALSAATAQIQLLPDTAVFEQNLKQVYRWFAQYAAGAALDSVTLAQLRLIAAQDPNQGGMAVLEARRWLPEQERRQYPVLGDTPGELETLEQGYRKTSVSHSPLWKIAPNPAQDRIFIPGLEGATGFWRILDASGRVLKTGQRDYPLGEGIGIGELPPGLFYLCLSTTNQTQTLRFVKQ